MFLLEGIGALYPCHPHSHRLLAYSAQLGYRLHKSLFGGFGERGEFLVKFPEPQVGIVRRGQFFQIGL